MKIVSVMFGSSTVYSRCAKVLEYTAKRFSPNAEFELIVVDEKEAGELANSMRNRTAHFERARPQRGRPPRSVSVRIGGHDVNNALKTKYHHDVIQNAAIGDLICLIDADTVITGDLCEAEQLQFDIAVTDKEGKQSKAPINSGVVFVRVNEKTKLWYKEWLEIVEKFVKQPNLLYPIKQKHLGINQSALSVLMEKPHDLDLLKLPCRIWNSTTVTWPSFNEQTKVVHILGDLRRSIFQNRVHRNMHTMKLAKMWRRLEKEMAEGVL